MGVQQPERSDEPLAGQTPTLLYNLVYCSRATDGVEAATVDRIIEASRRHNPRRNITGLLVLGSGLFFQWLEGPRDSVLSLLADLKRDPRHHTVVVLTSGEEVRERLFPDWDMELVEADAVRDVLVDALDSAQDPKNAASLRELLQQLDAGLLDGAAPR